MYMVYIYHPGSLDTAIPVLWSFIVIVFGLSCFSSFSLDKYVLELLLVDKQNPLNNVLDSCAG